MVCMHTQTYKLYAKVQQKETSYSKKFLTVKFFGRLVVPICKKFWVPIWYPKCVWWRGLSIYTEGNQGKMKDWQIKLKQIDWQSPNLPTFSLDGIQPLPEGHQLEIKLYPLVDHSFVESLTNHLHISNIIILHYCK